MSRRSVWMLLAVALIVVIPLFLGGEFAGADSQAAALIEARDGFAVWFKPIWEPPSSEVASLMFSLQAALGAAVIGYVIGRLHGRRDAERSRDDTPPPSV